MKIEEALFLHLKSYMTDLVGTRIYPLALPQGSTLPAVTYQKVSQVRNRTLGNSGLKIARARFQISCWAASYADVKEMAERVKSVLQDYNGLMGGNGGVWVLDANIIGERDIYEPEVDVYHLPIDVMICYEEG